MAAMIVPALQADGLVLVQHAEPLAQKLVAVARKHDGLYEVLKALTTSSVYGALFLEIGSIALAIAANHHVVIPGLPLSMVAGEGEVQTQEVPI